MSYELWFEIFLFLWFCKLIIRHILNLSLWKNFSIEMIRDLWTEYSAYNFMNGKKEFRWKNKKIYKKDI